MKFMTTQFIRPTVAIVGIATVLACGGGGGGTSSGGGLTAVEHLNRGLTAMNRMLADTDPVNTSTLAGAQSSFGQARQLDPQLRNANAGYAILTVALEVQRALDLFGISVVRSPENEATLTRKLKAAHFGLLGRVVPDVRPEDVQPIGSDGKWRILPSVAAGLASRRPGDYPVDPTYAQIRARLLQTEAQLLAVQAVLEDESKLPNDANPMVVTDPRNPAKTVKLGLVEIRALRSAVIALRSALNLVLAYNGDFDVAAYPYNQPFATVFAGSLDGRNIPTSAYLPLSPFGTLYADGKSRLAAFRTLVQAALTSGDQTGAAYRARTGSGFAVNPGDVVEADLQKYESDAELVRDYLAGPVSTSVSGFTTNVDVPRFVANPPTDLKALAPPIQAMESSAWPDRYTARFLGSALPDRTFGGLFRPQLPAANLGNETSFSSGTSVATVLGRLLGADSSGG